MSTSLLRVATATWLFTLAQCFSGPPISLDPKSESSQLAMRMGAREFSDERLFKPQDSVTFEVVEGAQPVDLHFLDSTNLKGFTAQDMIQLGPYAVESRLGMITSCNSPICHRVDGILGFGYKKGGKGNSLLTTLIQPERADWGIKQPHDFRPMPPKFAFTASRTAGELHLGGYDPDSVLGGTEGMLHFPMKYLDYGVSIPSIKYGKGENAVELLNFKQPGRGYLAKFDSGTSCILMPNTTLGGQLTSSPFTTLLDEQLKGRKESLYYTLRDVDGKDHEIEMEFEECVEPTNHWMILGDPWFRKFVVMHDLTGPTMGLGLRHPAYKIGEGIDDDYLEAFAGTTSKPVAYPPEEKKVLGGDEAPQQHLRASSREASLPHVLPSLSREATRERAVKAAASSQSSLAAVRAGHVTGKVVAEREHARKDGSGSLAMLSEALEGLDGVEKVRLATDRVVYTVEVGVGTPPQKRKVVFDTGSYMLGVFSHDSKAPAQSWEDIKADKDTVTPEVSRPSENEFDLSGYDSGDAPVVDLQIDTDHVTSQTGDHVMHQGRSRGLTYGVLGAVLGYVCGVVVMALLAGRRRRGVKDERARLLHV